MTTPTTLAESWAQAAADAPIDPKATPAVQGKRDFMAGGLHFVGVEIHRPYFDIACERIEAAQRQAPLLPPEEPRQPVQDGLL